MRAVRSSLPDLGTLQQLGIWANEYWKDLITVSGEQYLRDFRAPSADTKAGNPSGFALDGMPGRQMAIDADLNAGIIKPEEAKRRRAEIGEEAQSRRGDV